MDLRQETDQIERVFDALYCGDQLDMPFQFRARDRSPNRDLHDMAAFTENVQSCLTALLDLRFAVWNAIDAGDLTAWRTQVTSTSSGPLIEVPATGERAPRWPAGREWIESDRKKMMEQVRLVPEAAAGALAA